MKGWGWFFVLIGLCLRAEAQAVLVDRAGRISFFSEAPLENISAVTEAAASAVDTAKREIAFKVPIGTFSFEKKLMQEHFNENYLETDRYPHATFTGRFTGTVDWSRDGSYLVTVTGTLDLHGVRRPYSVPATFTIADRVIRATAAFRIRLADHQIKVPRIVIRNIAEEVDVQVSATYPLQQVH